MKYIHTDAAPPAVGPYSQGILTGKTIYVSGQLPVMDGVLQTSVDKATAASLANVLSIIQTEGGKKENIVKCVVFLTDMNDFKAMNEAYALYFGEHKPARSCVEVMSLPKDAVLEIEAVAVLD